jgi:hypothetical protein
LQNRQYRGPKTKSQTLNFAEDKVTATGFDFADRRYTTVFLRFSDEKAVKNPGKAIEEANLRGSQMPLREASSRKRRRPAANPSLDPPTDD